MDWPLNENYIFIFYVTLEIIQNYSTVVVLPYLLFKKKTQNKRRK